MKSLIYIISLYKAYDFPGNAVGGFLFYFGYLREFSGYEVNIPGDNNVVVRH